MFSMELFISAIEERPALHDTKNADYFNHIVRSLMWEEVGRIMFCDWLSFSKQEKYEKEKFMLKKWKSLKDCFNRELRLQKSNKTEKRRIYKYFNNLLFLLPNCENRISWKNTDDNLTPTINEPIKKKRKINSLEVEKRRKKSNDGQHDSDRMFLLSLLSELKMLPLPTKNWVKLQFMRTLNQASASLDHSENSRESSSSSIDQFEYRDNPDYLIVKREEPPNCTQIKEYFDESEEENDNESDNEDDNKNDTFYELIEECVIQKIENISDEEYLEVENENLEHEREQTENFTYELKTEKDNRSNVLNRSQYINCDCSSSKGTIKKCKHSN